jgi:glycosyltransferase involved in cell wall biosynthesis
MLRKSILMFVHQTYSACELVIIDDSPFVSKGFETFVNEINNKHGNKVRYIRRVTNSKVPPPNRRSMKMSIGSKRNLAIRHSNGSLIAFWDDDDIHGPNRIRNQVRRMQRTQSDLCANGTHMYHVCAENTTYTLKDFPQMQERLWWRRILMPSVMFKRELWNTRTQFPDMFVAEDREFFRKILRKKPSLRIDLWDGYPLGDFMYMIHQNNTAWSTLATNIMSGKAK